MASSGTLQHAHSEHDCLKDGQRAERNGKTKKGMSYYQTLMVKTEIGPKKGNHELRNDLRGAKSGLS